MVFLLIFNVIVKLVLIHSSNRASVCIAKIFKNHLVFNSVGRFGWVFFGFVFLQLHRSTTTAETSLQLTFLSQMCDYLYDYE